MFKKWSVFDAINQPINQSTNQLIKQSISSASHSINQRENICLSTSDATNWFANVKNQSIHEITVVWPCHVRVCKIRISEAIAAIQYKRLMFVVFGQHLAMLVSLLVVIRVGFDDLFHPSIGFDQAFRKIWAIYRFAADEHAYNVSIGIQDKVWYRSRMCGPWIRSRFPIPLRWKVAFSS
jgi:hypothetical protein